MIAPALTNSLLMAFSKAEIANPAQQFQRTMLSFPINESVACYLPLPKMSAAFFKISTSISSSRFRFFKASISLNSVPLRLPSPFS